SSGASAFPPATWNDGDEEALFGHTFQEEYWTNSSIKVQDKNANNLTFSASYVNYGDAQAFLLSLNMIENENGTGNFPFQFFGMHYYTPEDREVFIGAVFAFLMAYDDTYNGTGPGSNGLPDPGHENVYYVIPFGAAGLINATYVPQADAIPVQKLGPGHYRFGIRYQNLYAIVSQNFVASMVYASGWVAKFSELKVVYDISLDNETGELRAETFYTLGEVTELWGIILGIPIKVNPHDIPDSMGISVVHFMTVFTSKYAGAAGNSSNYAINPNINSALDEDIVLKVGDDGERAMKIGTRGTFDLINESSGAVIRADQEAMNAIVGAKLVDLLLVAWQLGFAAGTMSVFAYAMSDYVQSHYSGPWDLANKSLLPQNNQGFNANPLWYAVSFPNWDGYRVEHDPVYTAYTNMATYEEPPAYWLGTIVSIALIVIPIVLVIIMVLAIRSRKKNRGT
ncbi:MAG: hypothetical protein QXY98_02015, partial [Thermoplasmata archaeon]